MNVVTTFIVAELGVLNEIGPLLDLGATGLLAVVIWYLLRQISSGGWVPRRELDYVRSDRDARLAEKDEQIIREHAAAAEWRAAHETSEGARELLADQVRDLAGAVRNQNAFFDAFRSSVERWDLTDRELPGGP